MQLECFEDEYPCTLHGFTYFCCKCNDRDTSALDSRCRKGIDAVVYRPLHPICCTRYVTTTSTTTSTTTTTTTTTTTSPPQPPPPPPPPPPLPQSSSSSSSTGGCFPATAKISLDNGRSVTMSELEIGDHVQIGKTFSIITKV